MPGFMRALVLAWLCLMTYASVSPASAHPVIWLALGAEGGAYAEVAAVVRKRVDAQFSGGVEWVQALSADLERREGEPAAVVTVGTQAWRDMARRFRERRSTPLIATLLPASAYKADATPRMRSTAIWFDQPPSRQRRLLRELMPRARSVSLLFGAESRGDAHALRDALASGGFAVRLFETNADDFAQHMTSAFDGADVLVALPDPSVMTERTLPNLLAASYRRLVPVLAYSPGVVRAGALAAVYSTPADMGFAGADAVLDVLRGRALTEAGPAPRFAVSVNASVARVLNLTADEAEVLKRLEAAEAGVQNPRGN